jgi:hypothetical protein
LVLIAQGAAAQERHAADPQKLIASIYQAYAADNVQLDLSDLYSGDFASADRCRC